MSLTVTLNEIVLPANFSSLKSLGISNSNVLGVSDSKPISLFANPGKGRSISSLTK